MTEEYSFDEIRTHPIPQAQNLEDGCWMMNWHLETTVPFAKTVLEELSSKLSDEIAIIKLQPTGSQALIMSVISGSDIDYRVVWAATFRTILLLEKIISPISSIEGVSRDEWRRQFAILEHTGALDKDKTPLMLAAKNGDTDSVKLILDSDTSVDINAKSPNGQTALMYAAYRGHIEIVQLLLNYGADLKSYNGELTLLEAAVASGRTDVMKELLSAGADVNARNRYGETALMYAAAWGKESIVKLLLDRSADPNLKSNEGTSALKWATQFQHTEVIKLLKQAGAT